MNREEVRALIHQALGGRRLVWFGTRGDDAAGLEDLDCLAAVFSVVGRYDRRPDVLGMALEDHSGVRVDLDAHDIDDDPHTGPIDSMRNEMLAILREPSAVATYRPSTFLSGVTFARQASVEHLGMFKEHQYAFEHKPWVETAVAALDVPRMQWTYLSDLDFSGAESLLRAGPIVLRRSRSSGGSGVIRIDDVEGLRREWPQEPGGFVAVAPFLDGTIPVNVGAVAWDDGITTHWPSVQLIGIPELTHREFGFCGNDFSLARGLAAETIHAMERTTVMVGDWMRGLGYRGAFGVDFLLRGDVPLFMEVNPRFQGSSHASSILSRERGESCVFTDHLAAHLHLPIRPQAPLADRTADMPDFSYVVQHWPGPSSVGPGGAALVDELTTLSGFAHADVLLPGRLARDVGAPVYRASFRRPVTDSGFSLLPAVAARVGAHAPMTQDGGM